MFSRCGRRSKETKEESRKGGGKVRHLHKRPRVDRSGQDEARTSGGEPDITLGCVLGGADWVWRAHRLDQQHRRKPIGAKKQANKIWAFFRICDGESTGGLGAQHSQLSLKLFLLFSTRPSLIGCWWGNSGHYPVSIQT